MEGMKTEWQIPPALMLRMMAISPQTKVTGSYHIPYDCYEIRFNGLAKMFTPRLVVRENFRVLPMEWWHNLREKRVAEVAMQRLAFILHNNEVLFYSSDFHASDWRFEVQFDVSSPKNRAIYYFYACREEWGTDSSQNQVRYCIQLCTKGLDRAIVSRVTMIDHALYDLLNECMEWAQAQLEGELVQVQGGMKHGTNPKQ